MSLSLQQFMDQRRDVVAQFYPAPNGQANARGTIMLSSHIWWTELIAHALHTMGFNVLLAQPLYMLYYDDYAFSHFNALYDRWLQEIRTFNVSLILGGNSTAMVPHPTTGIMLHDAAGIPLVNYWWDEPRTAPTYVKRGGTLASYLANLKNPRTLNVIWDRDVLEELASEYQITNTLHVPLATWPEYWPQKNVPLAQRPLDACFLGNCHFVTDYVDDPARQDPLLTWANAVIAHKLANLDRPMTDCLAQVPRPPALSTGDAWHDAFFPWDVLNAVYMHRTRNLMVHAAFNHLNGKLALIGKGWDKAGLRANAAHAEANTGPIYASSKACLNLFGGCVHAGMPLRPFDIAACFGLIVTHYNRELPDLFEPGRECLAFRNRDEMLAHLDHILAAPSEFDPLVAAAHRRTLAQHTWSHRLETILGAAAQRFNLAF